MRKLTLTALWLLTLTSLSALPAIAAAQEQDETVIQVITLTRVAGDECPSLEDVQDRLG